MTAIRAEVEAELLRWAAGRVVTPAQLGAKARREVLTRDARAAARNLERALKNGASTCAAHRRRHGRRSPWSPPCPRRRRCTGR